MSTQLDLQWQTSRISRQDAFMEIAEVYAKRSTCNRLHVGAVIGRDGRVISAGYAGAPSGLPHCHPDTCNVNEPCTRTVHAEAGAISYAARAGISTEGASLYCTHCPCLECAKLIINSGIKDVVYKTPYRKTEGLELLRSAGIAVSQWTESQL
jgi:dCMP deaminase